ncbi:hypothetical protein [Arcanobacterium phocae]|uniref:hypothetical protein n=2 Tax=Arcanobacterium phocae TaxID=131112 RepID=UPI001C0EE9BC|nr:hypothetical protein [Arcanobacterium phocae]
MRMALPGFFSDVARWQRRDSTFQRSDGLMICYCLVVLIVGVALAGRYNLATLEHSPMYVVALSHLVALVVWLFLPIVQILLSNRVARAFLRTVTYCVSLIIGVASYAFIYGVWTITHTPHLVLAYTWEISVPAFLLAVLGLAGLMNMTRSVPRI